MKRKCLAVGIILLFIGTAIIPSNGQRNNVKPLLPISTSKTIYVDDNNTEGPWDGTLEHPYRTIQDGVNASHNGDTVFVFNGYYYETKVNRTLNLIGESKEQTIIINEDNLTTYACITLESNMTNMSGFTIRGEGETAFYERSLTVSGSYCNISNNIISTGTWGIILYSQFNVLSYNYISNCSLGGIRSWGFNQIVNNTLIKNGKGIGFGAGDTIEFNHLINNDEGMGGEDYTGTAITSILKNQIEANHIGIDYSNYGSSVISYNNFVNNTRSAVFYYPNVFFSIRMNWDHNYWSTHTTNTPKLILGKFLLWGEIFPYEIGIYIPWFNFDWHPAQQPYDIPGAS
jgi:parallel beta-helix repeat protein